MAVEVKQQVDGEAAGLWGRFDACRDHLFNQYTDVRFDPSTGLSLEELEAEVASYLGTHRDQPRVLQKANVFRIVVTRGQIAIDPQDWFVDKVNYGCLVRSLSCESNPDQGGILRRLSLQWLEEAIAGPIAKEAGWIHQAYEAGQCTGPRGGLDRGHIAPGWQTPTAPSGSPGVAVAPWVSLALAPPAATPAR